MNDRHIIIPPGVRRVVIVLSAAEVCALHALAQTVDDVQARQAVAGASPHASGQSTLEAGRRALEVLADVIRAAGKRPSPENGAE